MPRPYESIELIPVAVTAIQVTPESVHRAAVWSGSVEVEEIDPFDKSIKFCALNVPTLDGVKRAQEGDYVVQDNEGRFDVIKKAEFEAKYHLVD